MIRSLSKIYLINEKYCPSLTTISPVQEKLIYIHRLSTVSINKLKKTTVKSIQTDLSDMDGFSICYFKNNYHCQFINISYFWQFSETGLEFF